MLHPTSSPSSAVVDAARYGASLFRRCVLGDERVLGARRRNRDRLYCDDFGAVRGLGGHWRILRTRAIISSSLGNSDRGLTRVRNIRGTHGSHGHAVSDTDGKASHSGDVRFTTKTYHAHVFVDYRKKSDSREKKIPPKMHFKEC